MASLQDISTDTMAFPWAKRTPGVGLESTIAVAVALLLGHVTGHPSAGAIAAGAAYTVGFAVFHEALASALFTMGLLTLGIASGTLAGSLGANWTPVVLVLALAAAVNFGLLSALGPTEGWIGQQCGVFVIVAGYFKLGTHYAVGRTAMVLAGGALQMLVFAASRLLHQPKPESGPKLRHRIAPRLRELWSGLRGEVNPRTDTAPYLARLAITLLLSTAIYRHYQVRNGYWIPMTALLVLKPQWTNTLSRGLARLLGTLVAAGIAVLLAWYVPVDTASVSILVVVCAWATYALQGVNYAVFSLFTTLYIVFLFRFGGFSQTSAAHIRLLNTAVGGAIALAVDVAWKLLWPRAANQSPQPATAAGTR